MSPRWGLMIFAHAAQLPPLWGFKIFAYRYKHVAPLGLNDICVCRPCYKHVAPLGLNDICVCRLCYKHVAPLGLKADALTFPALGL